MSGGKRQGGMKKGVGRDKIVRGGSEEVEKRVGLGGAGGGIRIEVTQDKKLKIRVSGEKVLEMVIEIGREGGADSGVRSVGFLICVEIKNSKGGGGGKGEDERLEPTMVRRFVGGTMVRKDGVLTKEGNERGCEERDVIGGGSLGAEGGMLG